MTRGAKVVALSYHKLRNQPHRIIILIFSKSNTSITIPSVGISANTGRVVIPFVRNNEMLFRRKGGLFGKTSSPPAYSSQAKDVNPEHRTYLSIRKEARSIKATDTPQWLWSNNQCRQWLVAVLETLLHFSPEEAQSTALQFEGFGPSLYLMAAEEWGRMLGRDPARSVYGLILSQRHSKGAVPRGTVVPHGQAGEKA